MRDMDRERRDKMIYDLHVHARLTLTEIGEWVGLTRERVRQIVRAAGVSPEYTERVLRENQKLARVLFECPACGKRERLIPSVARDRTACSTECSGTLQRRYSRDDLLEHLRSLAKDVGRTPGMNTINRADGPAHTTYVNRFGSLTSAQIEAGLDPNPVGGVRARSGAVP